MAAGTELLERGVAAVARELQLRSAASACPSASTQVHHRQEDGQEGEDQAPRLEALQDRPLERSTVGRAGATAGCAGRRRPLAGVVDEDHEQAEQDDRGRDQQDQDEGTVCMALIPPRRR